MAKFDRTLDALFKALSDPGRREVVERLMTGPATVSEIAKTLDVAMPTALTHLTKLEAAGLIHTEKEGRTRLCHANPDAFRAAQDWFSRQRATWETRLDRLEAYLNETNPSAPRKDKE